MLPSTCILASQHERIDAKRREKQRAYAETSRDAFLDVIKAGPTTLASSLPSTHSGISLCGKVPFDLKPSDMLNRFLYAVSCLCRRGVLISGAGGGSNDI